MAARADGCFPAADHSESLAKSPVQGIAAFGPRRHDVCMKLNSYLFPVLRTPHWLTSLGLVWLKSEFALRCPAILAASR